MLSDALSRTILLAKTELQEGTPDSAVLSALTTTRVVLVANEECLRSHAGQCCYVAAALTLLRSGHSVWLSAPDVPLINTQPPLVRDRLVSALQEIGCDLLPGVEFHIGLPDAAVDIAVLAGPAEFVGCAEQVVRLGWSKWSGTLSSDSEENRLSIDWPIGALAAASFACSETFKAAMRKLREYARTPWLFDRMFAPSKRAQIVLAPEETPTRAALGQFDVISGGAITNSALFTLLRLPDVEGNCRVLDDDYSELSNLNRNALLRRSHLTPSRPKVITLAEYSDGLVIEPCAIRYDDAFAGRPLAANVLVGVDHIPSRWTVQRAQPVWLGVGATDAFTAYVSFHEIGLPCVGCLHPQPLDISGPIPTAAFVSFHAGLMLATYLVRRVADGLDPSQEQQAYMTTIRPETWSRGLVAANAQCPVPCDFGKAAMAA